MTPEEKSLLECTYKLVEENNSILRKMRRVARWGTIVRVLYWVVIIGVGVGAFYFLQPYIDSARGIVDQAQSTFKSISGTVDQAKGILDTNKPR